MSTQRRLTVVDGGLSKKGAHGHRLCRWCGAEVFPPKQTYCSDKCVTEWRLRSDVAFLRSQLFMRDKGVCKGCGLDTLDLRRKLFPLSKAERMTEAAKHGVDAYRAEKLMLWEADHIVAVKNGGGLTGLENFQTLCVRCHRSKTNKDLGWED
jgi:hypothetical protein